MIKNSMLAAVMIGAMSTLLSTSVSAQDNTFYKQQVVEFLRDSPVIKKLRGRQFKILKDGLEGGYVRVGPGNRQSRYYDLVEGYTYAFVGACDEDCRDLDLTLYGPDGRKLAADTDDDDTPTIWLLVSRTGRYRIEAATPRCNAPIGCYWGVQALWK